MDREIKDFLNEQGIDRPVLSIRQVGSRTEIHVMGDDAPLIFDPAGVRGVGYSAAQLEKKKMAELREIMQAMGLDAKSRKKTVLIENILKAQGSA